MTRYCMFYSCHPNIHPHILNTGPVAIYNLSQSIKGATHFKGHFSDFSGPSLIDLNLVDTVVISDKAIVIKVPLRSVLE